MKKVLTTVLIIVLITAGFVLLDRFLDIKTAFQPLHFSFSHSFGCCAAVVYGPIIGLISGALGQYLSFLIYGSMDLCYIICTAISFTLIGFVMRKVDIRSGIFTRKDIIRFSVTQNTVHFFCFVVLYPLLQMLLMKNRWADFLSFGFWELLSFSFSAMFISISLLIIYSDTRYPGLNFFRN